MVEQRFFFFPNTAQYAVASGTGQNYAAGGGGSRKLDKRAEKAPAMCLCQGGKTEDNTTFQDKAQKQSSAKGSNTKLLQSQLKSKLAR